MAWGRGGAGNIEQQRLATRAARKAQAPVTLDIQRTATDASSISEQSSSTDLRSLSSAQLVSFGRGGIGNVCSPHATGTFASAEDAAAMPLVSPSVEARHRGRGGAGNFVAGEEEQRKASDAQREQKEIELQEMARADVEKGLQRPEQVHLRATLDEE